jgi:hypothetical protein
MKVIGYITTFLVTIVLANIWSGYALSILWKWFIVPPFGAPQLTIGYAIGLALIWRFLERDEYRPESEDSFGKKLFSAVIKATVKPALFLMLGWVVTCFMH